MNSGTMPVGGGEDGEGTSHADVGIVPPTLSLPKGGGAVRGIGEKFGANPVTGTGSLDIPIVTSPGRSAFGPQLSLSYDSGAGSGPFGFGWHLSLPAITRKADDGLPQYLDAIDSDIFILSGSEDLVPVMIRVGGQWQAEVLPPRIVGGIPFQVRRYRPRVEGAFARVERWTRTSDGDTFWRSISKDDVVTVYGRTPESRITDPNDLLRVFSWLISHSYDDRGNAVVYRYAAENDDNVDRTQANERNRERRANRYPKRITYGNARPNRDGNWDPTDPASLTDWRFHVVFDYDEDHLLALPPAAAVPITAQPQLVQAAAERGRTWAVRPDPFSVHRAGFEVRTYRRCRRILTFHQFPELGADPYLVRTTELDYEDLDLSTSPSISAELAHPGSTRIASCLRRVTQAGYVRDDTHPPVTLNGVDYATYVAKSLPPLDLEYSKPVVQDDVREIDADSLANLPIGIDGTAYRWADLDGDGVSGILTEQADAWFYKPNLGGGRFGPAERLAPKPSLSALRSGRQQLLDLAGDGGLDLVEFADEAPGFYERTPERGWERFRTFRSLPRVPWDDPNLRFVDLDGDGHADVMITEADALTWYPSLGEDGFGSSRCVRTPLDEEMGPRVVLADGTDTVFLADMSGDGLSDLVRIRNGDVCYWPNQGYGRFGAKVAMDGAPRFDRPDRFDPKRVRLADVDGSGVTDIIYLGRDAARVYFNRSGNSWSEGRILSAFPDLDDVTSVAAVDLLGNGTACLVWSSPLPRHGGRPLRFIDLMGGIKPHLLIRTANNLGAETRVQYAASTTFFLADKAAGRPWITKLPFPVHVVERIDTLDRISGNRFVTRYAYHHGHFDGIEREFRGFGMVEQWDTEELAALNANQQLPNATNLDAASHVPPVHTKTWFHTGVHLGREHVSDYFVGPVDGDDRGEYYREPGLTNLQARALLLDDTPLPDGLTVDEEREACRALKGSVLRREIFADDRGPRHDHPYSVVEQNFRVQLLQPKLANPYSVLLTHTGDTLTYHYERDPLDPRVAHTMNLEVDAFGNVLKSTTIVYGRRIPDFNLPTIADRQRQTRPRITYSENLFTTPVDHEDARRTPLPAEARTYELSGYPFAVGAIRYGSADFVTPVGNGFAHVFDSEIPYEASATIGRQRRLIEHVRILYRPDDLGVALGNSSALEPLGTAGAMALAGETYRLAFTPGLLGQIYSRPRSGLPPEALLPVPANVLGVAADNGDRGGYVDLDGNGHWWIPSGRTFLSLGSNDSAAAERTFARDHFFLPHRYRTPFHTAAAPTETLVRFDPHALLIEETVDAVGNRVTVGERDPNPALPLVTRGHDYRVLQPALVMDANRNRSFAAFDALGMVAGTAVRGKPEDVPQQGDRLDGFVADLTTAVAAAHIQQPLTNPEAILGRATTRIVYDLFAYYDTKSAPQPQPTVVYTLTRETHDADLGPGLQPKIQHGFSYSDGFGRELQKKIQAEPGPVPQRAAGTGTIVTNNGQPVMTANDFAPRWVGSGWTLFNNKGKPVRQFEPFFSDTHRFDPDVHIGVSPIVFYDPIERVVATLHPNHTWEKVVFDAWLHTTHDVSDTALVADPKLDPDVGAFFARLPASTFLPTWHAQRAGGGLGPLEQEAASKAAIHADTPTTIHLDVLGRTFLTVAENAHKYSDSPPAAPPVRTTHRTRSIHDIEGNQRDVFDERADALGNPIERLVMHYDYDMLGTRIRQSSMDAGRRWMLNDVSGKLIRAWDDRAHAVRTDYDPARRSRRVFVVGADPAQPAGVTLTERFVYGEQHPQAEARNLRGGGLYLHLDQAGALTNDTRDFKGNLRIASRRLAMKYDGVVGWASVDAVVPAASTATFIPAALEAALVPMVESDTYTSETTYDALNRPATLRTPDATTVRHRYNESNLLDHVEANLRGALDSNGQPDWTTFVDDIDYDAKSQRTRIAYGNDVETTYTYDPLTFRLVHLETVRPAAAFPGDDPQPPVVGWPGADVQDLSYTYDAAGNVTHVHDDAQQTIYFKNKRVEPSADYTYDALNRLIEARGREHLGQIGAAPAPTSYDDAPRIGILLAASDGRAMATYLERYFYDEVGNLDEVVHRGTDPAHPGWTRTYVYDEASATEPAARRSNRLTRTTVGATTETYSTTGDGYDTHGNMLRMAQLSVLEWDFKGQLQMTRRQAVNASDADGTQHAGERTYYVYDAGGQRVRKVTVLANGQIGHERIYLGGFEIYRQQGTNALTRETLHVMDDKQRIALVETRSDIANQDSLQRYQHGNHLGTVSVELDAAAQLISFEEYYPFGSTSFQALRNHIVASKRYRYTGKERDEESGLMYHGARYYSPWLYRWTSADPSGLKAGVNLYAYVDGRPTIAADPTGNILWFFVAAVVVIATLTASSDAGAPTSSESAKNVEPHKGEAEFAAHVAVTGVSLAVGGGTAKLLKNASPLVRGGVAGYAGGFTQGVGDKGIEDAKKGQASSVGQYLEQGHESGKAGAVTGIALEGAGAALKKVGPTIKRALAPKRLPATAGEPAPHVGASPRQGSGRAPKPTVADAGPQKCVGNVCATMLNDEMGEGPETGYTTRDLEKEFGIDFGPGKGGTSNPAVATPERAVGTIESITKDLTGLAAVNRTPGVFGEGALEGKYAIFFNDSHVAYAKVAGNSTQIIDPSIGKDWGSWSSFLKYAEAHPSLYGANPGALNKAFRFLKN